MHFVHNYRRTPKFDDVNCIAESYGFLNTSSPIQVQISGDEDYYILSCFRNADDIHFIHENVASRPTGNLIGCPTSFTTTTISTSLQTETTTFDQTITSTTELMFSTTKATTFDFSTSEATTFDFSTTEATTFDFSTTEASESTVSNTKYCPFWYHIHLGLGNAFLSMLRQICRSLCQHLKAL